MRQKFYVPILLIAFSLLPTHTLLANVTFFSFTTKPQVILPGAVSKEITVQSQNGSSVLGTISETFDMNFTSTSGTGLFLGSTGKSASRTMSKNTANKSFYYKDGTIGDYVITVTATGRISKQTFKVSQNIKIGQLPTPQIVTKPVVSKPTVSIKKSIQSKEISTSSAQVTSPILVFEASQRSGFWSSILYLPVKIIAFIKHLFIEN